MVRFLGHLPLVRLLPKVETLDLPRGRLRGLSFDEWHSIDSAFPYRESQYEQTRPTFFELDLGRADGYADLRDAFAAGTDEGSSRLQTVYLAVLILSAVRLPRPELSTSYLVFEGDDLPAEVRATLTSSQLVRPGPAQRELIVHGDQQESFPIDEPGAAQHIAMVSGLLEANAAHCGGALAALVRTTRPGFSAVNETLHLVAGLETLLVERNDPQAETFSRRYSVLGAQDDDADALVEHASWLYRLRSEIVHGRPAEVGTSERDALSFDLERAWACVLVLRALQWFGAHPGAGPSEFRQGLDRGQSSPEVLASLRAVWSVR